LNALPAVLAVLLVVSQSGMASDLDITVVTSTFENQRDAGESFAGIAVRVERPVKRAVELAVYEASTLFDKLNIQVNVNELKLDPEKNLLTQLEALPKAGLAILDLPLHVMEEVAPLTDQLQVPAFNVRHSNNRLRSSLCLEHVFHSIPSDAMYFDALVQFLIFRGWRKVLVVRGPSERDREREEALVQSLKKFGANIVDRRVFTLSHHPDDRDRNRPDFLTGGASYDVVAVIDSQKDYGRYLQYSTRRARPVVGDVGLSPRSWHFALERYGAPQLNERYREYNVDEPLSSQAAPTDAEFAAWSAVKLLSNSLNSREQWTTLNVEEILSDPTSQVDLYKGTRGSIRQWNHQLRQPVLLAATDAVIAVAPMPKFLHKEHYVDTLGVDKPESECRLD